MARGRPSSKAGQKTGKHGGTTKRVGAADELLRHATTNLKRKAQAGAAGAGARPGAVGGAAAGALAGGDGSPYRCALRCSSFVLVGRP